MYGLHVLRTPNTLNDIKYYYDCCTISCIQIFLESPKKHRRGLLSEEKKIELKDITNYCKKKNITIFVHAPYTLNIGQTITNKNSHNLDWWISSLVKELKIANDFGFSSVILHVGKAVELDEKTGTKNMRDALDIIFKYLV